jgi:hypothetical protein
MAGKLILEQEDGSRAEVVLNTDSEYADYVRAFYCLMSFATFPDEFQQAMLGGNPWDWD